MVSQACKLAGVGRTAVYDMRHDEEFALAWADVEEKSTPGCCSETRPLATVMSSGPCSAGRRRPNKATDVNATLTPNAAPERAAFGEHEENRWRTYHRLTTD